MEFPYLIAPYKAENIPGCWVIDVFGDGSPLFLMLDSALSYNILSHFTLHCLLDVVVDALPWLPLN